ncbi:hypothetical protein [Elioraea rosea]|uniref:hypothetical protein n=1 Tax=Elioraea rosea TaxID=2492390 RepID=UPI0011824BF8|nr:hypothetical protein [Elioraea rosea]
MRPIPRRQRLAALVGRHGIPPLADRPIVEIGRVLPERVLDALSGSRRKIVEILPEHLLMACAHLRWRLLGEGQPRQRCEGQGENSSAVHRSNSSPGRNETCSIMDRPSARGTD